MKYAPYFVLMILVACSPGTASETSSDTTKLASIEPPEPDNKVFVNWMEVGVRETPGEKGKYVTTVYLAEMVELLGDTASEVSGKNRVHYNKVKLLDGKECWIRTDFIGIGAKPAVIIHSGSIFSRPDRVAVTPKQFEQYDVVAVSPVKDKDGWLEVKGKAKGENWFTHGYLTTEDVLTSELDVQFAALRKRAAAAKDQKMRDILEAQLQDSQFSGTVMYAEIFGIPESDEGSEEGEEEGEGQYVVSAEFLVGDWSREWNDADDNPVSEVITITDGLEYVRRDTEERFSISETKFNTGTDEIAFVRSGESGRVKVELFVTEYSSMKGTETMTDGGSIEVTYRRVGN